MFIWNIILVACVPLMNQQLMYQHDLVSVSVDETVVAPGGKGMATIQVKVQEGYHIQANKVNDKSLVPVSLRIIPDEHISTGKAEYPAYKLFRLEGTEQYLNIFDSVFIIHLPVTASATTKEGRYLIKAQLHYQACDDRRCLFPRTIHFELSVVVQHPASPAQSLRS